MQTQRIRVKFCGITREEDALTAVALGADAIGMVFYAGSPRAVGVGTAREIVHRLPPFISTVALFVNPLAGEVQTVLEAVRPGLLQFHGDETAADCERYGMPYIKAIRMRPDVDIHEQAGRFSSAAALLLDSFHEGNYGGTGQVFDWSRVPADLQRPFILAGGLTPDNVAAAIAATRPYAVDVSGGVEATKGIKDPAKMQAFLREVHRGCH
ncbi:MAG: phosphoribosylanthranilate isomerase [Gammaproteobacteria bacterium]